MISRQAVQPPPIPPRIQNDPEEYATQEQAGVYARTMKLYNEMKVAVFTLSLFKIIIVQLALLFVNEEKSIDHWNTIKIVAVSLTGSLLGIVTICLFLYGTCKPLCKEEDICTKGTFSIAVADFLMLLVNWCYFVGDNITDFYNIQSNNASKYRYASQYLLVIGLAGFVFVPRFKKVVQKHFCDTEDDDDIEDLAKAQNFTSNVIAIILEIDAFYTILTNTVLECNTAESIMPWCMYTVITIILIIYLILQAKRVIAQMKNIDDKIKVRSITPLIMIVAALFLLMDNNKPLNCSGAIKCTILSTPISNTTNIPGPHCSHNNTTRLIMTMLTTLIYSFTFAIKVYPTMKKSCMKYIDDCTCMT